jgi:hypothetical protein
MSECGSEWFQIDSNAAVWREVDGEVLVLELATAIYLTLNGSAWLLWNQLVDGATAADLAALLIKEYEIASELADTDVRTYLDGLLARSLLKVSACKPPPDPAG